MVVLKLFSLLLVVGVVNSLKYLGQPLDSYCLSSDRNPYLFFGSKSSYELTRGTAGSDTTCKSIQFWSLNRHGTRLAGETDMIDMKTALQIRDKIVANYAAGSIDPANRLCDSDLTALKNWTWDDDMEDKPSFLTVQGWKEVREIAQRYKARYPHLLGASYSPEKFLFRHTVEQRTFASCRAHLEGLFGEAGYDNVVVEEPLEEDDVIRPYAMCPTWIENVDLNDDFRKAEKRIFRKQQDYLKLLDDVTQRLGFKKTLKKDDIDIMYDNCRFNKAWQPDKVSPWCSVFTKIELLFLEYHDDLGQFYKSGYGSDYNPKLGCRPLTHLLETFTKTVQGEGGPAVTSMFSHDTLLNMMFTALGFGKDQKPLKGTDYDDALVNRKFRTSLNSPFAANVAAVLHECSNGEYQVQIFLNERPMDLEGCPRGLCSWDNFQKLLSITKNCNLDFCNLEAGTPSFIGRIATWKYPGKFFKY